MQKYSASFVSCSFYTITYSEDMYAVVLHQTNISYSNEMQRMYNHVVGRAGSIPSPIYPYFLVVSYTSTTTSKDCDCPLLIIIKKT